MIPHNEATVRIENMTEICAFLQNLKDALQHGARITFQETRRVDERKDVRFTNMFTVADLFPDEDPVSALRRELSQLTAEEYMRTVRDLRFPARNDMREFGGVYSGMGEVYIKIRVELLGDDGAHSTFVMSFHYAETPFAGEMFPYKDGG